MRTEAANVRLLFDALVHAPLQGLSRDRMSWPLEQGVYVFYGASKQVLHVGRTVRGRKGLHQRLRNHWNGKSSFVASYHNGDKSRLRTGHSFRCLIVEDHRQRALLEAYAIGCLCPAHIGLGSIENL